MNGDELDEWHNLLAETRYNLHILFSHYINNLTEEEKNHIWTSIDLLTKCITKC